MKNVEQYIATFPEATQLMLQELRACIKKNAPDAEEVISYQMPAYKLHGMLVYFAGYKNHIGFYPGASPIISFQKELQSHKNAKGSVQFPLDKKLPLTLIARMVKFKLKENMEKHKSKKLKK